MSRWGGSEVQHSPAQALAQKWINCFGQSVQRYRFVKLFSEYLNEWTQEELETIIAVLRDRHKNRMVTVTSPVFIKYVADDILAGNYLEGKRLEII